MEKVKENKTKVAKDFDARSILISREFNAPLKNVWRAYSEKELLDQWWGPQPWRAETKTMDFRPGGHWHYAMVGPDNTRHWGRMNYISIDKHKKIEIEDGFCDENGVINSSLPVSKGSFVFRESDGITMVEFKMMYSSAEELQKIVEMGFEQGITICLDQLETLLAKNNF